MSRTKRRWLFVRAMAVLLAVVPGTAGAQAPGSALVEIRIPSPTINGLGALAIETARNRSEIALAEIAGAKFPYLQFVPHHTAPGAPGARLVLELRDVVRAADPACRPRRVVAVPIVVPHGVEIPGTEVDFSEVCNTTLRNLTDDGFVEKMQAIFRAMLAPGATYELIEESLTFEVPLAKQLVRDDAASRLFLPVTNLRARKDSQIEVRFDGDANRYLLVHPFTPESKGTLVKVKDFACNDLAPESAIPGQFGDFWHPGLPRLLATCGEPLAFMKHYEGMTPAEAALSSPPASPASGSQPGIVTVLTGDEP